MAVYTKETALFDTDGIDKITSSLNDGLTNLNNTVQDQSASLNNISDDISDIQGDVSGLENNLNNFSALTTDALGDLDGRLNNQATQIDTNTQEIAKYIGYIDINTSEPSIKVAANTGSYLKVVPAKMSIFVNNNEVAYLSDERLYAPSAVVNNLYMQTIDAATGDSIGAIGWVMRSNGHLSMRRMR